MVVRISGKNQNYNNVTKLLVKSLSSNLFYTHKDISLSPDYQISNPYYKIHSVPHPSV